MATNEQLQHLMDQLPNPDRRGMLTDNIDKAQIDKTIAEIAQGGKENILGVIEMLSKPGSEEDVKPHFALHCLVNHALITKNEKMRKEFCEAIASQVTNEKLSAYNRSYLCQELQWAGRDEACPALGKVLLAPDVTDAAATALAAIGGERAASQLRNAVEKATGKARLNIMDALAALAEPKSAEAFKSGLADKDRQTRIAAAAGIANIALAESIDDLLKAADQAQGWERFQLTNSCLVLAENLAANGNKADAKRIYDRLQKSRTEKKEAFIQEAVNRGLAAIA